LFPAIAPTGLTGGAIWYDYQTRHPDRLTWLVACAARRAGATLANYVRALGPRRAADGRVSGATLRDELDGRELEVAANVTLLAAGPALGDLLHAFGAGDGPPLLRAMNVLLARPARDIALAAPGRSGRMLTAVPWAGSRLVGTAQSDTTVPAGQGAPSTEEVHAFLEDANTAFPALHAKSDAVRLVHWGLTPALVRAGRAELRPDPEITQHPRQRMIAMVGVKYTTARAAAEEAIDAAAGMLGNPTRRCRTADTPLPHASIADDEGRLAETQRALGVELPGDISTHLASWYGTEAPEILNHAAARGEIDRLDPVSTVLAGEISYAVETADAIRLSDAVLRRTLLGSAGHPGRAALERAASIMARLRGWSPEEIEREIQLVEQRYVIGT
jgi:glycerol-3-phosphate dehydrogenase